MRTKDASSPINPIAAASILVPQLATLVVILILLVGWTVGYHPFWPIPEVTVSEAAATADHAEVVRLITNGADPNGPSPVRIGIINDTAHVMTPLEAAVFVRRLELVKLLVEHGAVLSPQVTTSLIELAKKYDAPDIVAYLQDSATH